MEVIVKMLKKGEKVRGEGGMCTKNGSYCEKEKKSVGGGGGQGRCERRSEAFVKIKKKIFFFFFGGGGGQGGCEWRSEAFVKKARFGLVGRCWVWGM